MSLFAADVFTYAGAVRWQLWFDNPNKAAVLFACLALVALACAGAARRRWMMYSGYALFSAFCYALLHTFSRGGLLALAAGSIAVLAFRGRRLVPLLAVVACLMALPVGRSALGRLAKAAPGRDASVGNRMVLWQAVPRMVADAPGGWGLGNSGASFMSWYQPVERRENYRTLVGSHFTWLVELGRWGRLAYVAGWLFVLGGCGIYCLRRRQGLPLALWLVLGTASLFSSVAEAWELWVLPAVALVPVVGAIRARHQWVVCGWGLGAACVLGGVALAGLEMIGARQGGNGCPRIMRDGEAGRTVVSFQGRDRDVGLPHSWIVSDAGALGGASFGRVLRAWAKGACDIYGIADSVEAVPDCARHLTLCGKAAMLEPSELARFAHLEDVCVLSPEKPDGWLAAKIGSKTCHVVCGEFSASCPADDYPNLTVLPGVGDYIPDWPRYAFGLRGGAR